METQYEFTASGSITGPGLFSSTDTLTLNETWTLEGDFTLTDLVLDTRVPDYLCTYRVEVGTIGATEPLCSRTLRKSMWKLIWKAEDEIRIDAGEHLAVRLVRVGGPGSCPFVNIKVVLGGVLGEGEIDGWSDDPLSMSRKFGVGLNRNGVLLED